MLPYVLLEYLLQGRQNSIMFAKSYGIAGEPTLLMKYTEETDL